MTRLQKIENRVSIVILLLLCICNVGLVACSCDCCCQDCWYCFPSYEKIKNVKIDYYIQQYGLEMYSKLVINTLKQRGWGVMNTGSMVKYSKNNQQNSTKRKYCKNKQQLRWLASVLSYCNFDVMWGEEVQCYFYNNYIYICTNSDKNTKTIQQFCGDNFIDNITQYAQANNLTNGNYEDYRTNGSGVEDDGTNRYKRHLLKLYDAINNVSTYEVIGAITERKFVFIFDDGNNWPKGLHCERKIFEYLKKNKNIKKLDIDNLGGIRRPCAVCWNYLFSALKDNNSGVFWADATSFINTEPELTIGAFIERFTDKTHTPCNVDDESDD